ncbi:TorF family putative porin [Hyphomonas sediminis]|uniref:TorF family putative porin n=1 Tax=Hyphomonas sediminis TaxID=2866160 RepID=UPI001CEC0D97|nr:TorF family putative porin [Hyphomonas sediminis]
MRMKFLQAGVALAAMVAAAGTASAQGEFSGNVALTSDYVWRGVSQSGGDMAISGGFDYTNGMFYAGTWASSIDFDSGSDPNVELDFYGGLAGEFASGISWDVGLLYYTYPDSEDDDLDFLEIKGALGYSFDSGLSIGGEAYYDLDNENLYVAASAGYSLTDAFSVDGSVGNYQFDAGGDYTNWSLGGTYSAAGFDFDLRYWDTDIDGSDLADERVVFTIARSM